MAGREVQFPARSPDIGGGRIIPSPTQYYVTGEDFLRVVSSNALIGVSLKVQLRTARPDGGIQAQSFDHTPNADRSVRTEDFTIGVGSVLNVTAFAGSGVPKIGQTYVIVQLVRGVGAAAIVMGTLVAGYVTASQAIGFPGSPIQTSQEGGGYVRQVSGALPAAGASIIETVPTGARWELLAGQTLLLTDATAGNRTVTVFAVVNGVQVVRIMAPFTHVPVLSRGYALAQTTASVLDAVNQHAVLSWPTGLQLLSGSIFIITQFGAGPADQWSAFNYLVREWLDV